MKLPSLTIALPVLRKDMPHFDDDEKRSQYPLLLQEGGVKIMCFVQKVVELHGWKQNHDLVLIDRTRQSSHASSWSCRVQADVVCEFRKLKQKIVLVIALCQKINIV